MPKIDLIFLRFTLVDCIRKQQIADCRYRPLNQLFDNYNPLIKGQTSKDYYIHEEAGWTDYLCATWISILYKKF